MFLDMNSFVFVRLIMCSLITLSFSSFWGFMFRFVNESLVRPGILLFAGSVCSSLIALKLIFPGPIGRKQLQIEVSFDLNKSIF